MKKISAIKTEKTKPLTTYKANVLKGIRETIEEVKLIKQGRLKGFPAKELFDELRSIVPKNLTFV
jgi:hypothetical protein